MSGIAGIRFEDGRPVPSAELEAMLDRLAHRGPDAAGRWTEGPVGLGHRMLHTTPESLSERQPLVHPETGCVLTADARIDNRTELFSLLGVAAGPETPTDADLILAAYLKWEEGCPEHLIGDFAFAVWDPRRRRLFCARDGMGVKPFFYHHAPGRAFCFASEIKALFTLPFVPRRINEAQVARLLTTVTPDETESTYYEDVLQLSPAHALVVDDHGLRTRRYWSLDPGREIRLASDEEYAEAFRERFVEAVRCRVRSAFPVASSLSGGLDSSSVACAARDALRERDEPLHAFSAVFPGLPEEELRRIDERTYVQAVLRTGGIVPHEIRADLLSPLGDLDRMLQAQDEVFWAPNLYLHWAMYGGARAEGARVFLDGFDGDSVVSHGLARFSELVFGGCWDVFGTEIDAYADHRALSRSQMARKYATPCLAEIAGEGRWRAFAAGARYLHARYGISRRELWVRHGLAPRFRSRGRAQNASEAPPDALMRPEFARRIRPAGEQQALRFGASAVSRSHRAAHIEGLASPTLAYGLGLVDRASAAFGLEARYPFFDRRLMEFSVALPAEQKLQGGWTRLVQRRALEGIVPPEVQWRPGKSNLSRNFERNLIACERARLDRILQDERDPITEYVSPDAFRALYGRCTAEAPARSSDYLSLYTILMLSAWLERSAD